MAPKRDISHENFVSACLHHCHPDLAKIALARSCLELLAEFGQSHRCRHLQFQTAAVPWPGCIRRAGRLHDGDLHPKSWTVADSLTRSIGPPTWV